MGDKVLVRGCRAREVNILVSCHYKIRPVIFSLPSTYDFHGLAVARSQRVLISSISSWLRSGSRFMGEPPINLRYIELSTSAPIDSAVQRQDHASRLPIQYFIPRYRPEDKSQPANTKTEASLPPLFHSAINLNLIPAVPPHARAGCRRGQSPRSGVRAAAPGRARRVRRRRASVRTRRCSGPRSA